MKFQIKVTKSDPIKKNMDLLVYPLILDKKAIAEFTKHVKKFTAQDIGGLISMAALRKNKSGILFTPFLKQGPKRIRVIGIEKSQAKAPDTLLNTYAMAAKAQTGMKRVGLGMIGDAPETDVWSAVMGFLLGSYKFDAYKSEKDDTGELKLTLYASHLKATNPELEKLANRAGVVARAVFMARDMVQTPPGDMNPDAMVRKAEKIAWPDTMEIKIMRKKELLAMNANLLLAVGKGSAFQPALVHMTYKPKNARTKIALVGKGITYDAGGYHLKPRGYLEDMKGDMAGAAAVYGAIRAAAELNLPVEVHGIAAITDNMISASSMMPGDVFTAMNNKTVEVWDTDAEGRLVLADALTYADKLNVDYIIDLATLTGACVVALGEDAAGLFTENKTLLRLLTQASKKTGEMIWRLPMYESIGAKLKSDIADLKNIGGRWGGATQGAMFLREFVTVKKWAHIDIAGPALRDAPDNLSPKGGSGFGVALLTEFLTELGKK